IDDPGLLILLSLPSSFDVMTYFNIFYYIIPSSTPSRNTPNVGCGVSTRYNMLELGIRYNLSLAKKYTANQGSLKIKVNL
ncbi:MAG TPA: hypothetical protein LFV66_05145, partial [Rickettsia endosymbiont of Bembidion lapponicum]|nr:hypothetical protein [Rickettsia endosymbiont of Bembidion lapponicum]